MKIQREREKERERDRERANEIEERGKRELFFFA